MAKYLAEISHEINRQIAVLIDRRGRIEQVVVGDANKIALPSLGRYQPSGQNRFNGLRYIHTHLKGEPLSDDDLTDLALLRFDMIVAIDVMNGVPARVYMAHLLPDNPQNERYRMMESKSIYDIDFDFNISIGEIENEFTRMASNGKGQKTKDRILLVGVSHSGGGSTESTMDELEELARSADLVVAKSYLQKRKKLDPRYLIGSGKLHQLVLDSMQLGADMIIFDCALTPAQSRTISAAADVEVLDRNQLILAVFGQRAKTKAGLLQVELASLQYELPRLSRRAEGLSRITGGIGALGPGETKLEIHRRVVRDRINHLEKQIDKLGAQRALRRKRRNARGVPVVSIVGYTNSGKSTLFNHLTASTVLSANRLFATLDPTSRRVRFGPGREFVLTDTVGFIRDLPKELTAAFRATMEELDEADLLVHLVDVSNPVCESQIESVENILEQLSLVHIPQLLVFNKCDTLLEQGIEPVQDSNDVLYVSAKTGFNVDTLLSVIAGNIWPGYDPLHKNEELPDVE